MVDFMRQKPATPEEVAMMQLGCIEVLASLPKSHAEFLAAFEASIKRQVEEMET